MRVLVTRPPVLLLDAVTASLDPASADLVRRTIRQGRGQQTAVWVTHDLSIEPYVDRMIKLDQGQLTADPPSATA